MAIAMLGLLVVPTVLASGLYFSSTTSRDRAVERASRDLMVRLSLSHVGLEGVLAGRPRMGLPGSMVYANLETAATLCDSLADGGSTPFGDVAPLGDAGDRQNARSLCSDLDLVRALTTAQLNFPTIARLEGRSSEAIRLEANERYERYAATFERAMTRAERHTDAVARSVAARNRTRSQVQVGTIVILISLLAAMAVLARRNRLNAAIRRGMSARLAAIVESSSDAIIGATLDGTIVSWNAAATRLFGHDDHEMLGRSVAVLVAPDDEASSHLFVDAIAGRLTMTEHELLGAHENGSTVQLSVTVSPVRDGNGTVTGASTIARDITERMRAQDELRVSREELARQAAAMQHRAFHDPLTDLPNRSLFADRVDHALSRIARSDEAVSVLFMDLDGFKGINDTLGHEIGDRLLVEVAQRLSSCMRASDTVARFGGDEFAVLVEPLTRADEAALVVDRILAALREPFTIDGKELVAHASIGMAISGPGGESTGDLLRNADVAMYVAKEQGKGCCVTFEPAMHSAMLERLELEADLRRALDSDELVVHYQPIVDLATGRLSQVEALVRWVHPVRGLVGPIEFIPVAEDTGLITAFGEWVLREACVRVREWQLDHPSDPPLGLAVNLSAGQLGPALADTVARALDDSGLAPESLTLEITESLFRDESAAIRTYLSDLKAIGVKLAIDDFGTGYSSLSRLRQFPVDVLKIDRSFVAEVATSDEGRAIVMAVITMATSLGLAVVAEGVEDRDQLEVLIRHGCSHAQGFLLARPLDAAAMGRLLGEDTDDASSDAGREADAGVGQPASASAPRYFAKIRS